MTVPTAQFALVPTDERGEFWNIENYNSQVHCTPNGDPIPGIRFYGSMDDLVRQQEIPV